MVLLVRRAAQASLPANAAPRALCRRHGFCTVGLYLERGRLEVVIVERRLGANLT